jgi:hypothetical protein
MAQPNRIMVELRTMRAKPFMPAAVSQRLYTIKSKSAFLMCLALATSSSNLPSLRTFHTGFQQTPVLFHRETER